MRYFLIILLSVFLLSSCGRKNQIQPQNTGETPTPTVHVPPSGNDMLQDALKLEGKTNTGTKTLIVPTGHSGETHTIITNGPGPIPLSPEEEEVAKKRREALLSGAIKK